MITKIVLTTCMSRLLSALRLCAVCCDEPFWCNSTSHAPNGNMYGMQLYSTRKWQGMFVCSTSRLVLPISTLFIPKGVGEALESVINIDTMFQTCDRAVSTCTQVVKKFQEGAEVEREEVVGWEIAFPLGGLIDNIKQLVSTSLEEHSTLIP
eukprot:m.231885 g.231885  ORF g.231885 m.231885 type:complete len:152 (-) comp15229_c0_seq2:5597-6052(-)